MKTADGRAFTLIELLTVIAIIALLAAILFPTFSQARASARASVCLSGQKQLALAILMYAQDYDDRTPRAVNNASSSPRLEVRLTPATAGDNAFLAPDSRSGRRAGFLYPYVESAAVWRCPQDASPYSPSAISPSGSQGVANASSFQLNLYLTGLSVAPDGEWTSGDGLPLAAVPRVAETVALGDGEANDGTNVRNSAALRGGAPYEELYAARSDHRGGARHRGMGNYILLDGHVKALLPCSVSPMAAYDDPASPCPGCPDQVYPNATAFWNIRR